MAIYRSFKGEAVKMICLINSSCGYFVGGEYDNEYLCGMDIQETEKQILKIVKKKYDKTGGHNGNAFGDFDHLLNLPLTERNALLERMAAEKKIMVFNGPNYRMITLPK